MAIESEIKRQLHTLIRVAIQNTRNNPDIHMDELFKWQKDDIGEILEEIDTYTAQQSLLRAKEELENITGFSDVGGVYTKAGVNTSGEWRPIKVSERITHLDKEIKASRLDAEGGDDEQVRD